MSDTDPSRSETDPSRSETDPSRSETVSLRYREAGVDIDAQDEALREIKTLARATFTPDVLSDVGHFGGLFALRGAGAEPILVSSADGVGTKLTVAKRIGDYSTVGHDLVNHCVNDILVQGAVPLFFLDYVGAGVLDPASVVDLVRGVQSGCLENGCVLLAGETAEMPGFYQPGDYELVGFIVGVVDRAKLLDGSRVRVGDLLIGLPSSGLHTNGYSLARKVLFEEQGLGVSDPLPSDPQTTVGKALLATHRSYLPSLRGILDHPALRALAHITGGGLTDNLPRVLPDDAHAVIKLGCWEIPPVFADLQNLGSIDAEEMLRVFNMGVGMVAIVEPSGAAEVLSHLEAGPYSPFVMGSVQEGAHGVVYELEPEGPDGG